ncbi:MAG: bifunctional nuclease family protein [Myxococcales bacterium]|nr:bifunctional nuclease family protein [Myxococcales bacterium]
MRSHCSLVLLAGLPLAALAQPKLRAPPPEFVEMEVKDLIAVDGSSNAVLLSPRGEEIVVPIFIGDAEATAIRLRLDRQMPPRPLTHDLLETMIRNLGGRITKIQIDDLKDNVYLGRIHLTQGERTLEIDARPSDSIALALGMRAPIYAARKVIDQAGVDRRELERSRRRPGRPRSEEPPKSEL